MTRLAKITVIVFVASGIAFLGLLSGGRHDRAGARRSSVDPLQGHYDAPMVRYPGVREYPLAGDLKVGGSGMKMSYFQTEDDPIKIASFFVSHWKTLGYHVNEDITLEGGVVGAYDPATGQLRQVLIRSQGGKSMVFPSLMAQPLRPAQGGAAAGEAEDVPVYPGSEGVLHFGARDPGHRSHVIMFTNHAGLANNVGFYRSRLPEVGWKEVAQKAGGLLPEQVAQSLTFQKGNRELTINLTVVDTSNRVRVHVAEASGVDLGLGEDKGAK
jgi:hypothetical protein